MSRRYEEYYRIVGLLMMAVVCIAVEWSGSPAYSDSKAEGDKRSRWNAQSMEIRAQSMGFPKEEQGAETKGIFEGYVQFDYFRPMGVVSFRSDILTIYGLSKTEMPRRVEIGGHVSMQMGEWSIDSQEAFSDNLNRHVDFVGDVAVRRKYKHVGVNLKKVRFDILRQTIFSEEEDRVFMGESKPPSKISVPTEN